MAEGNGYGFELETLNLEPETLNMDYGSPCVQYGSPCLLFKRMNASDIRQSQIRNMVKIDGVKSPNHKKNATFGDFTSDF